MSLIVTSCSSPRQPQAASTTTGMGGSLNKATVPTVDPGHIVPAPPGPTTMPTEDPITPIRTGFDTGQQAVITAHGFEPAELGAIIGKPVVWTNLSGTTQRITLQGIVTSPLIPPGAQYVWTPNFGGSIAYRSASGFHALLLLQQ
jgi:hypothetical protein